MLFQISVEYGQMHISTQPFSSTVREPSPQKATKRSKLNSLVGQAVNVLDLLGPEQSEAIDDVEMFPPKQQQALRRVQTLYPGAAEHLSLIHI